MENKLRPIYQERASHDNTLGIIMIEKTKSAFPVTDTFDTTLLVIIKEAEQLISVKHYEYENGKASLYTVEEATLKEWLRLGSNRKVVEWILGGKILFDRNEYVTNLKEELQTFPSSERQIKMGHEFGKLIKRYQEGKAFFEKANYLDAYNSIIHALHHLARLSVIEKGLHPEVTVWNQVKKIEPEIYKLYEEVVESDETLGKRLELLFIASDFLIHSRAKKGGSHLIGILAEKKEGWSINEIMDHPELTSYSVDIEMMLAFLIDKHLIQVEKVKTKGVGIYHRKYFVRENR